MDYEKKYKEALKAIRNLAEANPSDKGIQNWVNDNFQELKEGEDERIRKEIIEYIKTGTYHKSWLAWLEKQGEQTSANKIEPKFKVGDWITNGATKPAQISSIEDDMYYTHNGTIGGDIESMDKDYHLWTIEDAKDGDVLATDSDVCIFDGTLEEGKYPFAYCGITKRGFESYNRNLPFSHDNNIHPATKEQRDTLMKAMTDAGYTFDFEKKELKKIEQKPAEWSEEDENRFRNLIYLVEHSTEGKASKEGFVKFINRLKSLKPYK